MHLAECSNGIPRNSLAVYQFVYYDNCLLDYNVLFAWTTMYCSHGLQCVVRLDYNVLLAWITTLIRISCGLYS